MAVTRGYNANGLNQYSSAGAVTFSYDPRGNLTSDGSVTYVYDSENKLVSAAGSNNGTLTYDPNQRLYQVTGTATTRFAYDGVDAIAEYDGAGALLRRYVHGPSDDDPIVWYEGAGLTDRRWLHSDERGSVVATSDASGNLLAIDTYDEYGIPGSANSGRFQYTGQMWLPELGLYHYKARAYSPTLGRFLQTDPTGYDDGPNWYAYGGDDPVNAVDHNGQEISYVVHLVAAGLYHSKIVINPQNQTTYRNDPRFISNRAGARVATIGAGPEHQLGSIMGFAGRLISNINRPTDIHTSGILVQNLTLPPGMSESAMISRLFQLDKNYKDNLNYEIFPEQDDSGYNSNGYVRGLLMASGFKGLVNPSMAAPGTNKPVPSSSFGVKPTCDHAADSRIVTCN